MQQVFIKFVVMNMLGFLIASCGGGSAGGTGQSADPRFVRLDSFAAQSTRVLGDAATEQPGMTVLPEGAMPMAGHAQFNGHASIRVERAGNPMALFGDAVVSVDFQSGVTTGTLDAFFGAASTDDLTNFEGAILLHGDDASQGGAIAYSGGLTAAGISLGFTGSLTATYLSDPVAGLVAHDLEAVIADNGVAQTGSLIVIGEGGVVVPP